MSGMHLAFVARLLAALGVCVCMCFDKRRDAPFSTHDKHSKQDKHCMRRDAPLDKRYYALHYAYNYHYVIIISTIIIYHLSSSRMHLASVARPLAALGVCVCMYVGVCVRTSCLHMHVCKRVHDVRVHVCKLL